MKFPLFAYVTFGWLLIHAPALNAQAPSKTRVYLLAGQSNIDRLAWVAPGCGAATTATNVTFLNTPTPTPEPVRELGNLLGSQQPSDTIIVGMIAVSSSALLKVNDAGSGFWINSANWTDSQSLVMLFAPWLPLLAGADEIHIIWGQGETDALSGNSTIGNLTLEYEALAQVVLAQLTGLSGYSASTVHLVTIGAVESAQQSDDLVNMVRLAHIGMERSPLFAPSIGVAYAAHHYDLVHDTLASGGIDPHHLSPCSFVRLARRIADGLLFPSAQPKVTGLTLPVPSGNTVHVPVSVALAPYSAVDSSLFMVIRNGSKATGVTFMTGVSASGVPEVNVTFPSTVTVTAADTISVRYVAGSGFQGKWASTTVPIVAAASGFAGRPLAPFFLER